MDLSKIVNEHRTAQQQKAEQEKEQERLQRAEEDLRQLRREKVERYLVDVVKPICEEAHKQLQANGIAAAVRMSGDSLSVQLVVERSWLGYEWDGAGEMLRRVVCYDGTRPARELPLPLSACSRSSIEQEVENFVKTLFPVQ